MHHSTPSGLCLGRQKCRRSWVGTHTQEHAAFSPTKQAQGCRRKQDQRGIPRRTPSLPHQVTRHPVHINLQCPLSAGSWNWGVPALRAARAICKPLEGSAEPGQCACMCVRGQGVPWPQVGCMSLSLQVVPWQGPRTHGAARGLWLRLWPSSASGSATRAGPGRAPSPTCCCPSSSWP